MHKNHDDDNDDGRFPSLATLSSRDCRNHATRLFLLGMRLELKPRGKKSLAERKKERERGGHWRDAGNGRPIKLSYHGTADRVKTILFLVFFPLQIWHSAPDVIDIMTAVERVRVQSNFVFNRICKTSNRNICVTIEHIYTEATYFNTILTYLACYFIRLQLVFLFLSYLCSLLYFQINWPVYIF